MADLSRYVVACLHPGKLAFLAILVSGGIVLQILACALYDNWWPMLTVMMYVLLPMPLLFFAGSDTSSLLSESRSSWEHAAKFLTGMSAVGSIAIPSILKHADVIGWGALAMGLSSFLIIVVAIVCFLKLNNEDDYSRKIERQQGKQMEGSLLLGICHFSANWVLHKVLANHIGAH
ncbi:Vps55/LEPROT, partial [Dillenia turbinata]